MEGERKLAYINEPGKIPILLKFGIYIAEKKTGKKMEPARILAWYPKAALSSGILESMVAHDEEGLNKRILQLIRMQVSILVNCSFCIDMNGNEFEKQDISVEEVEVLQGTRNAEDVVTFTPQERIAIQYTKEQTNTPIDENISTIELMKHHFNERQFVIIVSTIAQVNYWARLIKGFGIPPAGFREDCSINGK
ncbi:MAG: carboxymuconolactone decarboxylase family protein [Peptostreptococcaceae bacterium]|nr:carboxymuconolactone decarboxylase family protein [Peptostreptococcaceae bacterium]